MICSSPNQYTHRSKPSTHSSSISNQITHVTLKTQSVFVFVSSSTSLQSLTQLTQSSNPHSSIHINHPKKGRCNGFRFMNLRVFIIVIDDVIRIRNKPQSRGFLSFVLSIRLLQPSIQTDFIQSLFQLRFSPLCRSSKFNHFIRSTTCLSEQPGMDKCHAPKSVCVAPTQFWQWHKLHKVCLEYRKPQ